MALLTDLGKGYTKTGGNFFSRISNWLSYIPIVGPTWSFGIGLAGAAFDAGKWLLRGKVLSAFTALAAGGAEAAVNAVVPKSLWLVNAGSGLATGESLGTHARKAVEMGVGGLSGLLGAKPQVLKSYTAGIVSIAAPAPAGPGRFMTQAAQSRGEDPNAAYARLQSGQSDHIAALEAAQRQPNHSLGM